MDQCGRRSLGRQSNPLSYGIYRRPRICGHRHVAGERRGSRPEHCGQSKIRSCLALQLRQPGTVYGGLSSAHTCRRCALLFAAGSSRQKNLVLEQRRRWPRLAYRSLRQQQRVRGNPGRLIPRSGDLRFPGAAGDSRFHRILDSDPRTGRRLTGKSRRSAQPHP